MTSRKLIVACMLLVGSVSTANVAYAYDATPMEKTALAQLSPQAGNLVESRLVSRQTVPGVIETTLLNNVS